MEYNIIKGEKVLIWSLGEKVGRDGGDWRTMEMMERKGRGVR